MWNAFRPGVSSCRKADSVKIFLLANGVECESLNTEKLSITEEMSAFIEAGGEILACGTCLKISQSKGSDLCPISTMEDLFDTVHDYLT